MHFGLDFSMVGGSSSSGAFDPSKSDPLAVWDFSPNTVFQDVNGTIPATEHGDPVGLVLDRSQGLVRGSELTPTFTGFSEPTGVTVTPSSLTFASATDVQSFGVVIRWTAPVPIKHGRSARSWTDRSRNLTARFRVQ